MVFVGIDVAKDKHDCFIISSEGEVLAEVFTITNNRAGFECLLLRIRSCAGKSEKIKVGLEATGHYSYNILIGQLNSFTYCFFRAPSTDAFVVALFLPSCRFSGSPDFEA